METTGIAKGQVTSKHDLDHKPTQNIAKHQDSERFHEASTQSVSRK
jgi:hypothetical protein